MDQTKTKNILLLIADDLGLHLGCYGCPVQTPNIDKLASQGTRFTKAFASTASCSGSRSTIYSGLHTHENGQMGLAHGYHHFQTYDHIETMPQVFGALGYQTGIIGKVHVGPQQVYPWELREESGTRDVRWCANRMETFVDSAKDSGRPFHLTVGFRDPHRDNSRGGFGNEDTDVSDLDVPKYNPDDVEVPAFLTDLPGVRKELAEYYQAISRMDHGVGLMMDVLRQKGLEDSTLVVFVSDNGAPFVNSKTTLYDAGVKLPLIVRSPGSTTPGVVNHNIVSFVDIFPTFLDWAGASTDYKSTAKSSSPRRLGRSILPVAGASEVLDTNTWQQWVFGSHTFHELQNYWPTRFMRTHRFKYHRNVAWRLDFPFGTDLAVSMSWEAIRNMTPPVMIGGRLLDKYLFRGPEELFDLDNDPQELTNLAADPKWQDELLNCRQELEKWQYQTRDPWLYRDGISIVASERFQKQGLKVPDRFELDLNRPGNQDEKHWQAPDVQVSADNSMIFAG